MQTLFRLGDRINALTDPNLSGQERDFIVRELNELGDREEKYRSWLSVTDNEINLQNLRAEKGWFGITPLDFQLIYRNTAQSIPNNSETAISFNTVEAMSDTFRVEGEKIYVRYTGRIICALGKIQWAANATGRRALTLGAYNPAGTLLQGQTLHSFKPHGTLADTFPFATVFILKDFVETGYLQFKAFQDSGGNLNMDYFIGGLFLLR